MAFEIRKISDVGVGHPVVARLSVQMTELMQWAGLDKTKEEAVKQLYIHTLTWRLVRCHKLRDEIKRKRDDGLAGIKPQQNPQIQEVPHVIDLDGLAGQFLYEGKSFVRDLLLLYEHIYGCELKDASDLADMKDVGDGPFVKWAIKQFGADDGLVAMARDDQAWITELVRKRNAVEHPGGLSGTLTITNIRVNPAQKGAYISPTWQRTGTAESDILTDMDVYLDNLLRLAEDHLVLLVRRSEIAKMIAFYEIPEAERNKECPQRIRVDLSPEMLAKFPRKG
jgi:hypothetical protein